MPVPRLIPTCLILVRQTSHTVTPTVVYPLRTGLPNPATCLFMLLWQSLCLRGCHRPSASLPPGNISSLVSPRPNLHFFKKALTSWTSQWLPSYTSQGPWHPFLSLSRLELYVSMWFLVNNFLFYKTTKFGDCNTWVCFAHLHFPVPSSVQAHLVFRCYIAANGRNLEGILGV